MNSKHSKHTNHTTPPRTALRMISRRNLLSSGALVALLLSTGCARSAGDFGGRRDPIPDEAYPKIAAIENLHKRLVFSAPIVNSVPGQPMSVTVGVAQTMRVDSRKNARQNAGRKTLNIDYKFEFYDRTGRPIEPVMGWRQAQLPHAAQVKITGSALDLDAADWRLVIRPAR